MSGCQSFTTRNRCESETLRGGLLVSHSRPEIANDHCNSRPYAPEATGPDGAAEAHREEGCCAGNRNTGAARATALARPSDANTNQFTNAGR